ncbi:AsmA family protein, partial [Escherichia coli]
FAIRGDLGVVWERQKQETGWRSWVPWPHVHAEDIILGNPPDIPEVTMVHLPRVEATLAPLALLTKTVWLPWINKNLQIRFAYFVINSDPPLIEKNI